MIKYSWICLAAIIGTIMASGPEWEWKCINDNCIKQRVDPELKGPITSLGVCQLLCCKHAALWPKPTGVVSIGNNLIVVDPNKIDISSGRSENVINSLIPAGIQIFVNQVQSKRRLRSTTDEGKKLVVRLNITRPDVTQLTLNLDEGYELRVSQSDNDSASAIITADNFFGARHGLETLGQLMVYDDIFENLKMPSEASITDSPVYTYRGVLLDTARNYISTDAIKRTIDGISASKLNTFHWHLTDSHSFPYVSPSHPELATIGAYSPRQVYTPEDVEDIVQYGQERGVRILPEFDAPAHVGEGWQDTGFVVCFNKQPWTEFCVEPPCGQLNPTKDKLYDFIEDIYGDLIKQFNPDIFHMGGDEVTFTCWNSTSEITDWMHEHKMGRNEDDFVELWSLFQNRALERLDKQAKQKLPIILWSTTLTKREYVAKYLPKDRYIIQVWTHGEDQQVRDLLELGYSLILSNYDALYLDCGGAAWVSSGQNWCSPYKGWHHIYENSPAKIGGEYKEQFLGAEAALWTEQVDDSSVDGRIWPRAAAMAERLWSEPESTWREAEPRMLIHRERLINRGIRAEALEPQWCMHYQKSCPADST